MVALAVAWMVALVAVAALAQVASQPALVVAEKDRSVAPSNRMDLFVVSLERILAYMAA